MKEKPIKTGTLIIFTRRSDDFDFFSAPYGPNTLGRIKGRLPPKDRKRLYCIKLVTGTSKGKEVKAFVDTFEIIPENLAPLYLAKYTGAT